jgi:diguanylate cyclase (GGDEF)-like protein/putative nucleotidyltransferase with HDIG domain
MGAHDHARAGQPLGPGARLAMGLSAEALLAGLVSALEDHVYRGMVLPDGTYQELYTGPGLERLLGGPVPSGPNAGDYWNDAVHEEDRAAYHTFHHAARRGDTSELEYRLVGFDGRVRWVRDRYIPSRGPGGEVLIDGIVSDVSEHRRLTDELMTSAREVREANAALAVALEDAEHRSRTDALTGLWNRRHFYETLAEELLSHRRGGLPPGVILADVDHFKLVNDTHGHRGGDAVLVELSARIIDALRPCDVVARWGGEEFAMLIRDVPAGGGLAATAERVRRAVSATPFPVHGVPVNVSISVGAVRAERGTWTPDSLVDAADQALYSAKRRGRDRVRLFADLEEQDFLVEEPDGLGFAQALALAASVREGMPEAHCHEVSELAAETAVAMGLDGDLVLQCRIGGLLHDVGKIALPAALLTRPGPLTETEWAMVRNHPEIGYQIVSRVQGLADAGAAVRAHHERLDGSGYPAGLTGEEIPLAARIVAAADVYSTITGDRAYREPFGPREAVEELRRSAGTHLDPAVVDALCRVIGRRGDVDGSAPGLPDARAA